uniref:Uncharacterized protein n=1 Tax=Cacopsylla melanoneura TaxID=428564 RepID=A0A8D8PVW6_9HEMI
MHFLILSPGWDLNLTFQKLRSVIDIRNALLNTKSGLGFELNLSEVKECDRHTECTFNAKSGLGFELTNCQTGTGRALDHTATEHDGLQIKHNEKVKNKRFRGQDEFT